MSILLRLFIEFFRTGLFAVGGGLATLPFLYEMSANTGWFSVKDIANLVAVSESTPGPLGVNMGTFAGYTTGGLAGAIIAPLGLVTPSVIIIIIVSKILEQFKDNKYVNYAFYGLRAASTALIVAAALSIMKLAFLEESFKITAPASIFGGINWISVIIAAVVFVTFRKFKKHPIVYIICSAIIGVLVGFIV